MRIDFGRTKLILHLVLVEQKLKQLEVQIVKNCL